MHLESLETRTFLSADPHGVAVPLHAAAEGNLPANFFAGHATHLGQFTGAFNDEGVVMFTAAKGDELWAAPSSLVPTSPGVLHVEGNYIGGTGRFTGASGAFSVDLIFVNEQGDFVYEHSDTLTLQRPWNDRAIRS